MNMANLCAGCHNEILDRRFLKCSKCNKDYDLECANVPEKRFYNTMTIDQKNSWKCPLCRSSEPKGDNTNTPIRSHQQNSTTNLLQKHEEKIDITNYPANTNITVRKKLSKQNLNNSVYDDDSACSPLGNTLVCESPINLSQKDETANDPDKSSYDENDKLSIQKFTSILQENNKHILTSMQNFLQTQISNIISELKKDSTKFKQSTIKEQTIMKDKIATIDLKVKSLEEKCSTLQTENEKLQKEIKNLSSMEHYNKDTDKIIVLHGLQENYWEKEEEVIDRITNIFYEVLNVNLAGYIEEITYIGKKGYNRPIKIELISKRMRKYIIENSTYFRETGLKVTEYLTRTALHERRELKQALNTARKNGHHAVIQNNKLILNGKELTNEEINKQNLRKSREDFESSNIEQLISPSHPKQRTPNTSNASRNNFFRNKPQTTLPEHAKYI